MCYIHICPQEHVRFYHFRFMLLNSASELGLRYCHKRNKIHTSYDFMAVLMTTVVSFVLTLCRNTDCAVVTVKAENLLFQDDNNCASYFSSRQLKILFHSY